VTDNTGYDKNVVTTESWKKWISNHVQGDPTKSFFGTIIYEVVAKNETISSNSDIQKETIIEKPAITEVDGLVKSVMDDLYKKNVLQDTIIIITANHASDANPNDIDISQVKVPLIGIYPEKKRSNVNEMTSHYDVVPTLMSKVWNCKDSFKDYSYGSSLFSPENKNWLIIGSDEMFGVLDFQRGLITSIQSSGKFHVTDFNLNPVPKDKARESVVFEVLKNLTRFSHK
jgi:membrane-anchored protein YejM (alkaline phosphatase superfamily)